MNSTRQSRVGREPVPNDLTFDDGQLPGRDALAEQREGLSETVGRRGEDAVVAELVCSGTDFLAAVVVVDPSRQMVEGQARLVQVRRDREVQNPWTLTRTV